MKKPLIAAIFCISAISLIVFTAWITCLRGPNVTEIKSYFSNETKNRSITVDTKQSDVGLYSVQIEGEEPFSIEVAPQWTLPGHSYDWSR
jgi:hypothetical protein